uniref:Ig-like domain-containing protein n=1 Tax=Denticeps clupeoides TaxID=299321 RepID=A0AAY4EXQ8_9TELE
MTVQWHKDNIGISPDNHFRTFSEKNKYTLEIADLQQSDHGTYLCKASNSVGTATCCMELRVVGKPVFLKTFEPTTVAVGNPLHLECQVNEDVGVSITWMKDGKKLHNTMDCKLSFEDKMAILDIPKAKLKDIVSDTGNYTCEVLNEAGSGSCTSLVTVKEPPSFIKELQTSVIPNTTVRFKSTFKGTPPFIVKWLKDDTELMTGPSCFTGLEAVNLVTNHDETQCNINLIYIINVFVLAEPPSFIKVPDPIEGLKGKDVSLNVELKGTAPFEMRWFKDKQQLKESRKYKFVCEGPSATLHILGLEASDACGYECKASNSVGSAVCDAEVRLRGRS